MSDKAGRPLAGDFSEIAGPTLAIENHSQRSLRAARNMEHQPDLGPQPKGKPSAVSGQQSDRNHSPCTRRGDTAQPRVATTWSAPWVNTFTENEP